jgi:phosphatidylethanolamine-binding protein (PEBP) family uncharacterized protein
LTDYGAKVLEVHVPPEGHGIHEYIITVFALKTDKLGLNENINPAIV